jgi:L-asparagine transporter-like permease
MGYKGVLEENYNKAEKQTSKQMTCEVKKYNIHCKIIIIIIIIIIIMENRSIITLLIIIIIIIIIDSIIYYLCAEPTSTKPITDTVQYRYR